MSAFITFEGPEGSGKSTLIQHVETYFKEKYSIMVTREPGGIHISEMIRELLLTQSNEMDGRTEALLFAASRRQHLVEKVIPALNDGTIVFCDRFIDSSLAYQGHARNIGIDEVLAINQFAIKDKMPDLTIYLRVEPEIGLSRIKSNQRENNRLDNETLEFHKKVLEGYDILSNKYKKRFQVIDASQDEIAVKNEVIEILESYIKRSGSL